MERTDRPDPNGPNGPIDDTLRSVLTEDDRRLLDEMPDYTNVFTLMAGSLRSRMRPFVILGVVLGTIVTAFCVYAIIRVFGAETTRGQILWSLAATGSFIWVGLSKVWMWLQLERQAVLMELKRTELRVLEAIERGGRGV